MKDLMKKEKIEHKNSNTFTRSLVLCFRCDRENINRDVMQNSDGTWSFLVKGHSYAKFDDQLLYDDPTVSKVLFVNGHIKFLKELLIKFGKESDIFPFEKYIRIGMIRKAEMQEERTRNKKPLFKITVDVDNERKKRLNDYHKCLIATDTSSYPSKLVAFLEYGYEPVSNITENFVHCMSVSR